MTQLTLIKKTTEDIQTLEYVVDSCKALKYLHFKFEPPDHQSDFSSSNIGMSLDTLSTFIPKMDMKSVVAEVNVSDDYKILLYLMHKFPQLEHFSFNVNEKQFTQLNKQILTQLLNFSLKIDSFNVHHLPVDHDTISETLGDHWNSVSKPGSECLELIYSDELTEGDTYVLDILKRLNEHTTSFTYPISDNLDLRYVDFIEKNGKFIDELQFNFSTNDGLTSEDLPGGFMTNAFTHCPNLRKLYIEQWIIRRFSHSKMDLLKELSIDEILFNRCIIYPGAMEQLSFLLPKVKVLHFRYLLELCTDHLSEPIIIPLGDPDQEIVMPYTKIDSIIFEEEGYDDIIHFKIFASRERKYYYYQFSKRSVRASDEEEYRDVDYRVYICCETKPKIQLIRNSECILSC